MLAKKLELKGVTVNAIHPGHASTQMTQPTTKISKFIMSRISITPEEAAKTSIFVASSPEVEELTGRYFKKCQAVKSHKKTYDITLQKQLWDLSEKFIEEKL